MAMFEGEDEKFVKVEYPIQIKTVVIPELQRESISASPMCQFSDATSNGAARDRKETTHLYRAQRGCVDLPKGLLAKPGPPVPEVLHPDANKVSTGWLFTISASGEFPDSMSGGMSSISQKIDKLATEENALLGLRTNHTNFNHMFDIGYV